MRQKICVFTGEYGALEVWRDSVERDPDLFALGLLALRFRFFYARVDQRRGRWIPVAQKHHANEHDPFVSDNADYKAQYNQKKDSE